MRNKSEGSTQFFTAQNLGLKRQVYIWSISPQQFIAAMAVLFSRPRRQSSPRFP